MDDKKSRILAVILLATLITLVTIIAIYFKPTWIFFTLLGITLLSIFIVLSWLIIQHQKLSINKALSRDHGNSFLKKLAGVPTKFKYEELKLATQNFSLILGKGGSGCVFKGILSDGTCVAVKRMECQERGEKEFRAEISAIGCVQHMNLVRMYGYCIIPKGPRFLVYEFIQNGSLDAWIFPRKRGCLPWKLRYKVAVDVAKALSYLHNDCRSRILHLDVKPENILLDDKFHALVSDFGLAKLIGKDESMVVTRVRGTRGYLAPEWILENGISAKSDVYSYGMLLLEMIGGRRNVHIRDHDDVGKSEYFPKIVFEKMKEGKLMEVVDKRLLQEENGKIDENEVRKLVYIALWCIQEKVKLRPHMAQVVHKLEGLIPMDEPPETEMFLLDLLLIKNQAHNKRLKATVLQISESDSSNASTSGTISSKINTFEPITMLSGR